MWYGWFRKPPAYYLLKEAQPLQVCMQKQKTRQPVAAPYLHAQQQPKMLKTVEPVPPLAFESENKIK